jgi:HK97 family phage prohead protease
MERRFQKIDREIETRSGRTIYGYGVVFNRESVDLGGFIETIDQRAFDHLLSDPNIMILANHRSEFLLGRTGAGTAKIGVDDFGLWYEVTIPESRQDIYESVERRDMVGSSFGFFPGKTEWTKPSKAGDPYRAHITKVDRLFDVGPVTFPAYPDTTTQARSVDAMRKDFEEMTARLHEGQLEVYRRKLELYERYGAAIL